MTVGEVTARLTLDLTGFRTGLAKANSLLEQHAASMQQAGMALAGFGGAIVGGLVMSVKAASDMQSALTDMNKVLMLTGTDLQAVTEQLHELARATGIQTEALAANLANIARAGISGAAGMQVLEAAARAAAAGGADLATVTDSLVSILRAYNLSASHAGEVTDTLYQASLKGRTTFQELMAAIKGMVPIASQLGVGYDQLAAALATMTTVGYDAENSLMGMNMVMVKLTNPSKQLKEALHAAGYASGQALIQAKGLAGAIEFMAKAAGDDEQAMIQMAGGARAFKAVAALAADGGALFAQKLQELSEAAGSVNRAFAQTEQTFRMQWSRFVVTTKQVAEEVGNVLLPTLTTLVGMIQRVTAAASEWTKTHQGLTRVIVDLAAVLGPLALGLGGLLMALGPLTTGITALGVALPTIGSALAALGSVIGAVLSPIGLLVAAVVGLTAYLGIRWARAAKEAHAASRSLGESFARDADHVNHLIARMTELQEKTALTTEEKQELRDATAELAARYPDLIRGYDQERGHLIDIEGALDRVNKLRQESMRLLREEAYTVTGYEAGNIDYVKRRIAWYRNLLEQQKKSGQVSKETVAGLKSWEMQLRALEDQGKKTAEAITPPPPGGPKPVTTNEELLKTVQLEEERLKVSLQVASTQKEIDAAQSAYLKFAEQHLPIALKAWRGSTGDLKRDWGQMAVSLKEIIDRQGALTAQQKLSQVEQAQLAQELLRLDVQRARSGEEAVAHAQRYVDWLARATLQYRKLAAAPGAKPEVVRFAAQLEEEFHKVASTARWTGVTSAEAVARMYAQIREGLPLYATEAAAIQSEMQALQDRAQAYDWTARQEAEALEKVRDAHRAYYAERPAELASLNARIAALMRKAGDEEAELEIEKARFATEIGQKSFEEYLDLLRKREQAVKGQTAKELAIRQAGYRAEHEMEQQKWELWLATGEKTLAEYAAELRADAEKMVPWSAGWIAQMMRLHAVERELHQQRLSWLDEEIAAHDRGYQEKIQALKGLLQGERNMQTRLELQREIRSTIDSWLQSELHQMDQQVLTLDQQRDILTNMMMRWAEIDARVLPQIQERLRAVTEELLAQSFNLQNLFIGAASSIESAFTGFFEGLMQRTKGLADLWADLVSAIEHQLAEMLTRLLISPFFEKLAMARRQQAAAMSAAAGPAAAVEGAGQQLSPALNAFAQAANALVPGLGGWVASAAQLVLGFFAQQAAAATQVGAAAVMGGVAATQMGAGTLMVTASAAMAAAAAVMMTAATTYAAAGAAGGLLGFLGLQRGGIVTRPTLAVLGEAGREAVVPLDQGLPANAITFEPGAITVQLDPASLDALGVERLSDRLMRHISRHVELRLARSLA
jgi:TP901 family phage tail tape measure protein